MDNPTQASSIPDLNATSAANASLIESFREITSSSKEEALFFLESHQWDLDAAVSTFLDSNATTTTVSASAAAASAHRPIPAAADSPPASQSPSESQSPNYSPSQSSSPSRSRSRSPSPKPSRAPYQLRSREGNPSKKAAASAGASRTRGGIRTLNDLNRAPSSSDEDEEPQQYYTGGEKSGMLVQDPTKKYGADSIFDQARHSGAAEIPADYLRPSSSRSFTGTGRLLSGETVSAAPQPPEAVNHTVTLWRNGFTVDDGPLRRFDDPANTAFLESIMKSECPKELEPADRRTKVHLDLIRREDNYSEPEKRQRAFQGVGRTLGSSSDATASETIPSASLKTAPLPATGLVVDSSSPTTSIQLRLADGTRMVSHFNLNHTVRDIRTFIEASRPGGARNYQLLTMGFPPKQLTDLDLTIEEAGIANSVVIQKF